MKAFEPTPRSRFAPIVISLITIGVATSLTAESTPLCEIPHEQAPQAAPVGFSISGDDLNVQLVADPALSHVVVTLSHDELSSIASTPAAVDANGRVDATLYGALADADTRAIGYHLSATDLGGDSLMAPYPLSLVLECSGSAEKYSLIPGVSTGGLLVTRVLSEALAQFPPCDLHNSVRTLMSSLDPSLCAGARTLSHQLDLLVPKQNSPGASCRYEWQTVVTRTQNAWLLTNWTETDDDASHTLQQLGGLDSGAASCFSLQSTSLVDQPSESIFEFPARAPGTPDGFNTRGTTRVEQSILCLEGDRTCDGACAGSVAVDLAYAGCVSAQALGCEPFSKATGFAEHDWRLMINTTAVPLGDLISVAVSNEVNGEINSASAHYDRRIERVEGPSPTRVRLDGEAILGIGSTSASRDASSYAFAETNSTYILNLFASGATCTESAKVSTTLTMPPLPETDLSGGLKMKRWWPDNNNTWLNDGWPGPDPPVICDPG